MIGGCLYIPAQVHVLCTHACMQFNLCDCASVILYGVHTLNLACHAYYIPNGGSCLGNSVTGLGVGSICVVVVTRLEVATIYMIAKMGNDSHVIIILSEYTVELI